MSGGSVSSAHGGPSRRVSGSHEGGGSAVSGLSASAPARGQRGGSAISTQSTTAKLSGSASRGRVQTFDREDGLQDEHFNAIDRSEDEDAICETLEYAPSVFHVIRNLFGVNTEYYKEQLTQGLDSHKGSGKSGAFMFFSADRKVLNSPPSPYSFLFALNLLYYCFFYDYYYYYYYHYDHFRHFLPRPELCHAAEGL